MVRKCDIRRLIKPDEKLTIKELQAFMNLHGISHADFASIFGVTPQAVHLWLTGQRGFNVTYSRLVRLFMKYPHLLKDF